jgi:hypothetical protein
MSDTGTVVVGTAATLICSSSPVVTLMNAGTTAVWVGGSGVTVGTGTQLPASMTEPLVLPMDVNGLLGQPIYGISSVASQSVTYYSADKGS